MPNLFAGLLAIQAPEPILILRQTRRAMYIQGRNRGLDRDLNADVDLGTFQRSNREQIPASAKLFSETSRHRKRESGEVRETTLNIRIDQPIYASDDTRGEYADLVCARGDTFKVTNVTFDNITHFYRASLTKVSDDFSVLSGA